MSREGGDGEISYVRIPHDTASPRSLVCRSVCSTFITGPPGPPGPPGQPPLPGDFVCPARPNHGVEGRPIMLRANHFQVSYILTSALLFYMLHITKWM